jgi:hypothetical protein
MGKEIMQLPIEYGLLDIIVMLWPWQSMVVLVISSELYNQRRLGKEKTPD